MKYRLRSFIVYGTVLFGIATLLERLGREPEGMTGDTSITAEGSFGYPPQRYEKSGLHVYSGPVLRVWNRYPIARWDVQLELDAMGSQTSVTLSAPDGRTGKAPLVILVPDDTTDPIFDTIASALAGDGNIVVAFTSISRELHRLEDGCLSNSSAAVVSRAMHILLARIAPLLRKYLPLSPAPDLNRIAVAGMGQGAGCALILAGKRVKSAADEYMRYHNPSVRCVLLIDAPCLCRVHDMDLADLGISTPMLTVETQQHDGAIDRRALLGTGGPIITSSARNYFVSIVRDRTRTWADSIGINRSCLLATEFFDAFLHAGSNDERLISVIDSIDRAVGAFAN